MRGPSKFEDPLCQQISTELFFPEASEGRVLVAQVKSICERCPHLQECEEWGINKERYGIWGGLTENQRRKIRIKRNIIIREEDVA